MIKHCFFSLAAFLFSFVALAQPSPYEPDTSYGQYGISRPNTSSPSIWIHQIHGSALQADGKLVLAGQGNFQNTLEIVRLDTTGALDTSFNHTGFINIPANGSFSWLFVDIRITASGDIVAGFTSSNPSNVRMSTMCFKPNGTLNTSYGISGKADVGTSVVGMVLSAQAMDVQADGKIVLAGGGPGGSLPYKYVLARLKTNGTLDTSFGVNGIIHCPYFPSEPRNAPIYAIKVQTDGKILCTGNMPGLTGGSDTMALIRYKPNGTLDTSFGTDGLAKHAGKILAGAIDISATGEIYVIGRMVPDTLCIKKFTSTGAAVSSFGTAGTLIVNTSIGTDFIDTGNIYQYWGRFVLLNDGKMLVAGSANTSDTSDFRVCRLMPDGSMDTVFAPNGTITIPHNKPDYCTNILVQSDNRILLTGYTRIGTATFDTCFVYAIRFRDTAKTIIPPTGYSTLAVTKPQYAIFPNPTHDGQFIIQYTSVPTSTPVSYIISNITGQVVSSGHFVMQPGNATQKLVVDRHLPHGTYILQLVSSGQRSTHKLLLSPAH